MIVHTFQSPRYYLRRDPDAGWVLALGRLRFWFQVRRGK